MNMDIYKFSCVLFLIPIRKQCSLHQTLFTESPVGSMAFKPLAKDDISHL